MKGGAVSPAVRLFRHLTGVPTAPFHEEAVARRVLAWSRRSLGGKVRVRRLRGGLVLSCKRRPGPALVVAAHMDHPGLRLSAVTARGARAEVLGGFPAEFLPGAAVEAFAAAPGDDRPAAEGVLVKGRRGSYRVSWTRPPGRGARPVFAMLALPACGLEGRWLASRSIDDVLGCAIALEALRRVVLSKARANFSVLLHRAEEVGFVGALDLVMAGDLAPGDSFISLEASRSMEGAAPGLGPVIRTGDRAGLFDPNLVAFLDETALKLRPRGWRFQRARLTGGTCEATAHLAFGFQAAGLAIPLVNYHNRGLKGLEPEKVRLGDIEPAVRLLVSAARRFPDAGLRGGLRRRLTLLHRRQSRRLS
ncbi:MAG: hypothetical protein HY927_02795 [Elusimicrobia bacterium]|nr:hypothetical protein [Elusimicrobiota bacterium]